MAYRFFIVFLQKQMDAKMNIVDDTKKDNGQKPFRLSSLDDPTDEQLNYIMEQVAISARESSRKANENLQKRLQEVKRIIAEERKQAYHG